MTVRLDRPRFLIWIPGRPRSQQAQKLQRYTDNIREAARASVDQILTSNRIDVEVWFAGDSIDRGDVDNVLKPVLDALKGIVYADDSQVRSVLAAAIPRDDTYGITCSGERLERLLREAPCEFLIKVYVGPFFRHAL